MIVDWGLLTEPLHIVLVVMAAALVLAVIRLVRGPSLPDRVVALDLLTALAFGFVGTYSILVEQPVFVDVAVVIALVTFVGTVAFARYLERRQQDE